MTLLEDYQPLAAGFPSPDPETEATSPHKNRVRDFYNSPSGRKLKSPPQPVEITSGCVAYGYETASGRAEWLQRDPIGERGGLNLYAYCGNNPVNAVDPLGFDDCTGKPSGHAPTGRSGGGGQVGPPVPPVPTAVVDTVIVAGAVAIAIATDGLSVAVEAGVEGEGAASSWGITTSSGAGVTNVTTDVTADEAASTLESNGYNVTPTSNPNANIYANANGDQYVIRPSSSAPGGQAGD